MAFTLEAEQTNPWIIHLRTKYWQRIGVQGSETHCGILVGRDQAVREHALLDGRRQQHTGHILQQASVVITCTCFT